MYAVWEANTYNITYNLNDGTPTDIMPTEARYDEWFYVAYPVRVGYRLTEISVSSVASGTKYQKERLSDSSLTTGGAYTLSFNPQTAINYHYFMNWEDENGGTVSITFKWTVNTYNVTIDANGGTLTNGTASNVAFGTSTDVSFTLVKNGYKLAGFEFSGASIDCTHTFTVASHSAVEFSGATYAWIPGTVNGSKVNLLIFFKSASVTSVDWIFIFLNTNLSSNTITSSFSSYFDFGITYPPFHYYY